jgi:hypothetical protein
MNDENLLAPHLETLVSSPSHTSKKPACLESSSKSTIPVVDDEKERRNAPIVNFDVGSCSGNAESVANGMEGEEFLSRHYVETLMREQDAELLESGPNNASGMTPVLASRVPSEPLSVRVPSLSLLYEDELAAAETTASNTVVLKIETTTSPKKRSLLPEELSCCTSSLDLSASMAPVQLKLEKPETIRRALSGDIWIKQDELFMETKSQLIAELHAAQTARDDACGVQSEAPTMKRSGSHDRRLNEAAQFAEAVGDIKPTEQRELRIIEEEEADDDDDDDDGTEIRVERARASLESPEALTQQSHHSQGMVKQEVRAVFKTRPQWPFGAGGSKRIFFDMLPEQDAAQDFVYKGIRSNPPEIVKSGTTRGNYAQLHRKAWCVLLYCLYWPGLV